MATLGGIYTELDDQDNILGTKPTETEPEPSTIIAALSKGYVEEKKASNLQALQNSAVTSYLDRIGQAHQHTMRKVGNTSNLSLTRYFGRNNPKNRTDEIALTPGMNWYSLK